MIGIIAATMRMRDVFEDALRLVWTGVAIFLVTLAFVGLALLLWLASMTVGWTHDDGRYANNPLHAWFDTLASGRGACCSNADGITIEDVDYDTNCAKPDCHYRVRLLGQWYDVDDDALVTVPNKFGRAVVWPVFQDDEDGHHVGVTYIRCFMHGAGA